MTFVTPPVSANGRARTQNTLRVGESDIYSRAALSGGLPWIHSASEKKARSIFALRADYRGIIRGACSLRI